MSSFFGRLFGSSSKPPVDPADVPEVQVITRDSNTAPERLAHAVGAVLDTIQQVFPTSDGVVAEVLIPSRDGRQLITEDIRPKGAPLLFTRIRASQSPIWSAFATRQPQLTQRATLSMAADSRIVSTRLASSRSALSIPIMRADDVLGVLNLESRNAAALSSETTTLLRERGLLADLAAELAKIQREFFSDAEVTTILLEKMEDRLAYTILPDDMSEAYYQILSVSAGVVQPSNVSAGLVLVYNRSQELAPQGDQDTQSTQYAVRAARFGAFNSALEWELQDHSIARRIIRNKKGEVLLDAENDPDYRQSGTRQDHTGELSVPLLARGDQRAAGVICLVTPQSDNFDSTADLARMEKVAAIAVEAIRRSEKYKLGERRSEQQRCADQLQISLARLFPNDMRQVTGDLIGQVRTEVGTQILQWALSYTNSQHGAFVLIQETPEADGPSTFDLVMTDQLSMGKINTTEFPEHKLPRWAPNQGYTGQAFQRKGTLNISNVYTGDGADLKPEHYIPYFQNAQSEVATPLIIGDTVLGVLDVEADEVEHYTSDYVDWIEFLARQAAFALSVIDRASKTRVELEMADLSRQVDAAIMKIRDETLRSTGKTPEERVEFIQDMRRDTVNRIIDRMCALTNAWVGRFLIELNSYTSKDTIDEKHGRLYYMASSDPNETSNVDARFFGFEKGVSAVAFKDGKRIVFNTEAKRHPQYFDSNPNRKSLSGIFQPVIEGSHVTGVLNVECEQEGSFSPELIQAFEFAGNLISKLLTGSRLRIDTILREMLREFDFSIMRLTSSDLLRFMDIVLTNAAHLSLVTEHSGWGVFVRLQRSPSASAPQIEELYWHDFSQENTRTKLQDSAHAILEYPLFKDVIAHQLPAVILDRREQLPEEQGSGLWPQQARSVIAVPLLAPKPVGDGSDVIGILALAHPDPAEYSEHDKFSLGLFAESIVYGLKTIELMQARAELMRQVRQYMAMATTPAADHVETALEELEDANALLRQFSPAEVEVTDRLREHISAASTQAANFKTEILLAGNITSWFLDLVNDDLRPDEGPERQPAQDVLSEGPICAAFEAFADIYSKKIAWYSPQTAPMELLGGDGAARLIRAAIFEYLSVACKITPAETVMVSVEPSGASARFGVRYEGPELSEDDANQLFALGATSSASGSSPLSGIQQALSQVRQIAERLGGHASFASANQNSDVPMPPNGFFVDVPVV